MQEIIISIISSGLVSSTLTFLFTKGKYQEEVIEKKTSNMENLLKIYKETVDDYTSRYEELSDRFNLLQSEVLRLKDENMKLKLELIDVRRAAAEKGLNLSLNEESE